MQRVDSAVPPELEARICEPEAGERLVIGPTAATIKLSGDYTARRSSVIELELDPGFKGPPAHAHRRFDHIWYVLEGEVRVTIDRAVSLLRPGACAFVPRGIPHGFENAGEARARFLEIDAPAATEGYFRDLARAFPPGAAVDRARVAQIQREHDTEPVE